MKVVVACDSFKGSLTTIEVAEAASAGLADGAPGVSVVTVPVADGGEGTACTVTAALGGEWRPVVVRDPLMREIEAGYGVVEKDGEKTAVIDMASASGITLLTEAELNPAVTTTYGTGQLIAAAYDYGCHRFLIGIGGSATNDGGKGMLEALGVRFLDATGNSVATGGASLGALACIDMTAARADILGCDITVMCDVGNPLCGADGASAVYGPQKGADAAMVTALDSALAHYAAVVRATTGRDVAEVSGSGAAGGMGAAFLAFTDARLRSGIDAVLDLADFDRVIADADLVITGEGRIDRQTLCGKAPAGVLARCRRARVPVVAIAGAVCDTPALADAGFADIIAVTPANMPASEAMRRDTAAANVRSVCALIGRRLSGCSRDVIS